MTTPTLTTRNTDWGFWGTIARTHPAGAANVAQAWALATDAIAAATEASPEGVRDFLDSRHGRHFADDVSNGLAQGDTLDRAIAAATARWMGWRIDRRTARETGIPVGLPYLTGFAVHFEILAEAEAGA